MAALSIYAHPASQPSRAVIWACLLHGLEFSLYADAASISARNPRGQLPVLEDDGLTLVEMPAILLYLAEKHAWRDVYPESLGERAQIVQYLHAHHSLSRLATLKLMAPHVLVVFGELPVQNPLSYINNYIIGNALRDPEVLSNGREVVVPVIEFLQSQYLGHGSFIGGAESPSLADIACYEELGQLQTAGLLDLSAYPQINDWLGRMAGLPFHDEVHHFNHVLGDIVTAPNTMHRFAAAIESSLQVLATIPGVTLVNDD